MRLSVVSSHPIQYHAPWFRELAKRVDLHVYFAHRATGANQAEAGFGLEFDWDCDLTGGYSHTFLYNRAARPGITRFGACDTPEVRKVLYEDRPDAVVVLGWHFKSYIQATRAARALKIPVLVRTDSHLGITDLPVKRVIKSVAYPLLLRCFDLFLPTGTRAVGYLKHYQVASSRISVVPPCIDTEKFGRSARCSTFKRDEIRARWGATRGSLILLFVGKFIGLKRPGDVLFAAARLLQRGIAVHVVLVGTGPLEDALRIQAAELGIPTTFVGFVNQSKMPLVYVAADLLILPSESETWGLTVNEAFACGLPAIVSDRVGCAPDLIDGDKTGQVFPAGDSQILANVVHDWRNKIGDPAVGRALEDITERYSPKASSEALVAAARALTRR